MAIFWMPIVLAVCCSVTLTTGCDNMKQDFQDVFHLNMPTPSEAAQWMVSSNDPEKRRMGIMLISNAPFGGEPMYVEVYRNTLIPDNQLYSADPLVRAAAAHALAMHGHGEDAMVLAPLLKEPSRLVRWEAAKALQRLHDPNVAPALIDAMLNDEEPDVRMAAANALGQYPQPQVVEALIAAIGDRSLAVNQNARRALKILTGQDFGTEREAWTGWYRNADDPFAGGTEYRYPVYSRDLTWYEKFTPFGASGFEDPGRPRQPETGPDENRPVELTNENPDDSTKPDEQPSNRKSTDDGND